MCRWRRQTRLRQVGASGGLRGDVYYFAPCSKKLRTYPEVTRVSKILPYLLCNDGFPTEMPPIPFNLMLIMPPFLYCFKCLNSYRENLLKILARPRSLISVSSKMSLLKFPHIIYLFIHYFVLFSPFPSTCLISLLLLILLILLINTDERHAR